MLQTTNQGGNLETSRWVATPKNGSKSWSPGKNRKTQPSLEYMAVLMATYIVYSRPQFKIVTYIH